MPKRRTAELEAATPEVEVEGTEGSIQKRAKKTGGTSEPSAAKRTVSKTARKTSTTSKRQGGIRKDAIEFLLNSEEHDTRTEDHRELEPERGAGPAGGGSQSKGEDSDADEEPRLADVIDYDLDILFCDISPGPKSLEIGHHFGNPLNHFWYCLQRSGLTSSELSPTQEDVLLRRFHIGITELVPVSRNRDPSKEEMVACFPDLLRKVRKYRPRIVCFTGIMMADNIQKAINKQFKPPRGTKAPKSGLGLQAYKVVHGDAGKVHETVFYAIPSVQGKVTTIQKEAKAEVFIELRKDLKKHKAGQLGTAALCDITSM